MPLYFGLKGGNAGFQHSKGPDYRESGSPCFRGPVSQCDEGGGGGDRESECAAYTSTKGTDIEQLLQFRQKLQREGKGKRGRGREGGKGRRRVKGT